MKRTLALIMLMLAAAALAQGQQPEANRPPGVVSVIHKIDLFKLLDKIRKEQNVHVGVSASAAREIINLTTGLIMDDQGHIITRLANLDPTDKNPEIMVVTGTGAKLKAALIGIDGPTGFAILKAEPLGDRPQMASSNELSEGTTVQILSADAWPKPHHQKITIAPLMRVIEGKVRQSRYSKLRGALTIDSPRLLSRNDSSIVLTKEGRVAGVARFAGFGRAHLFPADFLRDTVLKRVLEKNDSVPAGWLGIYASNLPEQIQGQLKLGAIVREVLPNSPAAQSGIKPDDIIVRFEGAEVSNANELSAMISALPAGHKVKLQVIRDRKPIELEAVLGERSYEYSYAAAWDPGELARRLSELETQYQTLYRALPPRERFEALRELQAEIYQLRAEQRELMANNTRSAGGAHFPAGFTAIEMTSQLAAYFGTSGGLLVTGVNNGSPAERAGLRAGDVIIGTREQSPMPTESLKTLLLNSLDVSLRALRNKKLFTLEIKPTN
jgi:serine protease Do